MIEPTRIEIVEREIEIAVIVSNQDLRILKLRAVATIQDAVLNIYMT